MKKKTIHGQVKLIVKRLSFILCISLSNLLVLFCPLIIFLLTQDAKLFNKIIFLASGGLIGFWLELQGIKIVCHIFKIKINSDGSLNNFV